MHPTGQIGRARDLAATSDETRTAAGSSPPESVDLAWLLLDRRDRRSREWLEATVQRVASRLASDGLLYVLPPPGWRARAERLLAKNGWQVSSPLAHLRVDGHERAFVPLTEEGLSLAGEGAAGLAGLALRGMATLTPHGRAPTALIERFPRVGFAAWRPDSPGPYAWLRAAAGIGDAGLVVFSLQSWRGSEDSLLLRYVGTDPANQGIAKVSPEGRPDDTEADALRRLGAAARSAGAEIPEVLGDVVLGSRRVTLMTRIEGAKGAVRLRGHPRRLAAIVERTAGWLIRWNQYTAREVALTSEELERWILEPAGRLAADLRVGERYLEALRELCARVEGMVVPRAGVHNDLTMHNVLVAGDSIGILDWESAREDGLPLQDLEYMIVDAVAAVRGYRDRAAAWSSCFDGQSGPALLLREWRQRSIGQLRLSTELASLCHQVCWLQHARNEAARSAGAATERPFLEITDRMAQAFVSRSHG